MDLSKDDLISIEHALTREAWATAPVNDLLLRVRRELLETHGYRAPILPRPDEFRVTEPKPKGTTWPVLRQSN